MSERIFKRQFEASFSRDMASPLRSASTTFSHFRVSFSSFGQVIAVAEAVSIASVGLGADFCYHALAFNKLEVVAVSWFVALGAALLFYLIMQSCHLYAPEAILNRSPVTSKLLTNWVLVFCLLLVFGFLYKSSDHYSRGSLLIFFISGLIMLPSERRLARICFNYAIGAGWVLRLKRVVLFGRNSHSLSKDTAYELARNGYEVHGFFEVAGNDDFVTLNREVSTAFLQLRSYIQKNLVDEVLIVFSSCDQRAIDLTASKMLDLPLPVSLLLDSRASKLLSRPIFDSVLGKAVELQRGPLSSAQQRVKRVFDISLASTLLVLLAPAMVAISILIRMDSTGPVIFRQTRVGFAGRAFRIFKFRTMTTFDDGLEVSQAVRGDKRVTRAGRLLRKTSLDELPQLINVLRGEMSLVGPRPHALSHDNEYTRLIAIYALRHHMKPGITGWAQANGYRGETADLASMEARVDLDIWYIKNWNVKLDLLVLWKTGMQLLNIVNVY